MTYPAYIGSLTPRGSGAYDNSLILSTHFTGTSGQVLTGMSADTVDMGNTWQKWSGVQECRIDSDLTSAEGNALIAGAQQNWYDLNGQTDCVIRGTGVLIGGAASNKFISFGKCDLGTSSVVQDGWVVLSHGYLSEWYIYEYAGGSVTNSVSVPYSTHAQDSEFYAQQNGTTVKLFNSAKTEMASLTVGAAAAAVTGLRLWCGRDNNKIDQLRVYNSQDVTQVAA